MIRRRDLLIGVLASGAAAAVAPKVAAQPARKARVGWLTIAPHPMIEPFREGMRSLGYVEGENLIMEYRYAEGRADRLPALAADLAARGDVDAIVASGGAAVAAASAQAKTVPVVGVSADLARLGITAGLARPGGNVTGVSLLYESVSAKWLELVHELLPSVGRVGVLLEEANASAPAQFDALRAAARPLDIALVPLPVRDPPDGIDGAFDAARRESVGAMVVLSSALFAAEKRRILEFAARSRLPTVYEHRDFAESGGLLSYGPDLRDVFRRAAAYVDKILKGVKPGDLPIEQPTKFELVLNLKTAKTLGLAFPPSLLARADEVIE